MLVDDVAQLARDGAEDVLPAGRLEARVAIVAPQRDGRAVGRVDGEREAERLAAGPTAVGRVVAIAADADEPSIFDIGQQAAADAAVRALGRGGLHWLDSLRIGRFLVASDR